MCIFAHPDDETFGMGGIIAAAVRNGQQVICITATRGELGVQDEHRWPAERLGEIRTQEVTEALKILGVRQHHWLDYPDGGCQSIDNEEAVSRLTSFIEQLQPDSIMTFGPDGLTGHPDHQQVSAWTAKAKERTDARAKLYYLTLTNEQYERSKAVDKALNFYFNTPKPPTCDEQDAAICLHLSEELFQAKMNALRAMPSQYQIMFERFEEPALRGCFDVEAFIQV